MAHTSSCPFNTFKVPKPVVFKVVVKRFKFFCKARLNTTTATLTVESGETATVPEYNSLEQWARKRYGSGQWLAEEILADLVDTLEDCLGAPVAAVIEFEETEDLYIKITRVGG